MVNQHEKFRNNNIAIRVVAILFACFFLYTGYFGVFEAPIQRSMLLLFTIVLGLMHYRSFNGKLLRFSAVLDTILIATSIVVFGYFVINPDVLNDWMVFVSDFNSTRYVISVVGILLILEVGRRATGVALPIVGILAMLYGRFGYIFSGPFYHKGFSWKAILEFSFFGFDGVFGLPISTCSNLIIIFIIFGCFFEQAGGGEFLMDLGKHIAGRTRGGPAKIAVIASALFGSISGSAVANVYATGSFSIPMMKRMGYRDEFAGAVEAVASTGGQLAPPVMGAAAFIMADFTGLPYIEIMKAAIIPAILYYLSLFLQVDFESALNDIRGLPKEDIPTWESIKSRWFFFIPFIVLLILLIDGKSASYAGAYSILSTFIVSWFSKETRLTPEKLAKSLELSGKRTIMIAASCAISGIVIGVVAYTGLGLNFVGFITNLSESNLWVGPILVAISAIILGIGVPTTVAYIIVSAVSVPALRSLGFEMLPSHMFAFYFAIVSMITPPVAPAALAGSEIAGATFMKTGFAASKLGIITFIIPFMFLFAPELMLIGKPMVIAQAIFTSLVGVIAFAAGLKGWLIVIIPNYIRVLFLVSGFCMIKPGVITDIIGVVLLTICLIYIYYYKKLIDKELIKAIN